MVENHAVGGLEPAQSGARRDDLSAWLVPGDAAGPVALGAHAQVLAVDAPTADKVWAGMRPMTHTEEYRT